MTTTYPFTIHNLYSSEQRNIQRLVYDTHMDKYGYFYGAMEVVPLFLQIGPEEKEIEDMGDLLSMMTTPEGEVVVVENKEVIGQPLFYNIDISRIEVCGGETQVVKVFFKATKNDDRTSNTD